jgi:hypothetical protein
MIVGSVAMAAAASWRPLRNSFYWAVFIGAH